MRKELLCIWLFSCVLLGLLGCNDIPSEHQSFFQLSPDQREKAIFAYPLDQQIDLMIIGWTKPHPPLNLFFEVAKNGEPIVALLIQRFSKINDMQSLRPIAMCLYEVNLRYFEWTTNQEYEEMFQKVLAEKSAPAIRDEFIKILETGKLHPNFTEK